MLPSHLRQFLSSFSAAPKMAGPKTKPPPPPTVPTAIKSSQDVKPGEGVEYATFAAGCFWGVEHLFNKHYSHLPQFSAISGYTGGDPSSKSPSRYLVDPGSSIHRFRDLDRRPRRGNAKASCCLDAGADCVAYRQVCSGTTGHAEAVRVDYQKGSVGYGELVEFFYRTHDPTTKDSQGPDRGTQYRSAIFYHSPEQKEIAEKVTAEVQEKYLKNRKIVTEITEAGPWYDAEDYHQEYLTNNPGGYECPTHIFYW
ncbi:Peptide-methionine (S)-S-oxide reductase [Saitozyma podzolica]|uniref:peptide-methionine (S)-S-oxide reductase n=1 Tax=Saitozyma podzolica TaxID=1890683 RepID=A0A427YKC0_9TREE|nr:Peptide-methionine (S)-S-oxide reductase [Saitozyma podzolica]